MELALKTIEEKLLILFLINDMRGKNERNRGETAGHQLNIPSLLLELK